MTVVATVILLIKIISRFLRGASQQLIMGCFLRVLSVNRFFTIEMTVVATVVLLNKNYFTILRGASQQLIVGCFLRVFSVNRFLL